MNKELELYIKNLAIDHLMESKLGEKVQEAMLLLEKVQSNLYVLHQKSGEEKETLIKAVTVATFSILKKLSGGQKISQLSSADWKEIAEDISDYAIMLDDQYYVKSIFSMYEKYIIFSAEQIEGIASEKTVLAIKELAGEIHENTERLTNGQIKEVEYIESCLWISLDAMIKLIASTASLVVGEDYATFVQALASYAFEYGRFKLYSREQVLVNEFIESQQKMDKLLEEKYFTFLKELEKETEQFYVLIDNAFTDDFRESFLYSIQLAQTVGVEDVLTTIEDVDSFFVD